MEKADCWYTIFHSARLAYIYWIDDLYDCDTDTFSDCRKLSLECGDEIHVILGSEERKNALRLRSAATFFSWLYQEEWETRESNWSSLRKNKQTRNELSSFRGYLSTENIYRAQILWKYGRRVSRSSLDVLISLRHREINPCATKSCLSDWWGGSTWLFAFRPAWLNLLHYLLNQFRSGIPLARFAGKDGRGVLFLSGSQLIASSMDETFLTEHASRLLEKR